MASRESKVEFLQTDTRRFTRFAIFFQILMASADSLQGTFATLYAVGRGSSGIIQGIIVSIRELGTALFQPIWGYYSDIRGRRGFVVTGLLIQALSWSILMPLAQDPFQILIVFIFQTTLGTMVIPTWNGWLGDYTQKLTRGRVLGRISILGTWITGLSLFGVSLYMQLIDPERLEVDTYSIAFRVSGVFYLLSAIVALFIPQVERFKRSNRLPIDKAKGKPVNPFIRIKRNIRTLHPAFRRYLKVEGSFRIAWAAAWPIFPYATLSATNGWIEIIVIQVAFAIALGFSQLTGGILSDKFGRKPVIQISRSVLVAPPILFGLGVLYHEPIFLIVSNILVGLMIGASTIAQNSLILDIAPEGKESTYFSISILVVGIVSFMSSLTMGFILDIFAPTANPDPEIIATLLFAVAGFRFLAWFVYFALPETINREEFQ